MEERTPGKRAAAPLLDARGPWTSWSRRVVAHPQRVAFPSSEAEIRELAATAEGEIRVVGTGHSCTPLCATDALLVNLDLHCGIVDADTEVQTAAIRAGSKIHDLGPPLREAGLATLNQGDVDVQSLAGAISTGTHGTGPTLGSILNPYLRRVLGLR